MKYWKWGQNGCLEYYWTPLEGAQDGALSPPVERGGGRRAHVHVCDCVVCECMCLCVFMHV